MELIKMPGVCGLACEVCGWPEKGLCPTGGGCVAGTDSKAPEKLEKFKAAMDHPCVFLECAIENKNDHYGRCSKFPCDVHYQAELYSKKFLDMVKGMQEKK